MSSCTALIPLPVAGPQEGYALAKRGLRPTRNCFNPALPGFGRCVLHSEPLFHLNLPDTPDTRVRNALFRAWRAGQISRHELSTWTADQLAARVRDLGSKGAAQIVRARERYVLRLAIPSIPPQVDPEPKKRKRRRPAPPPSPPISPLKERVRAFSPR